MAFATTCPSWSSDLAEHSSNKLRSIATKVRRKACLSCRGRFPDEIVVATWHKKLFTPFVPLGYYAGNYRQTLASMPCLAVNVQVGSIPGSHYLNVLDHEKNLFRDLKRSITDLENDFASMTKEEVARNVATIIGVGIGSFIRIHGFINGNGRTSRLLWTVLMYRIGLPAQVSTIKKPPPDYYNIMSCSMNGNDGPLIAAILKGINDYDAQN